MTCETEGEKQAHAIIHRIIHDVDAIRRGRRSEEIMDALREADLVVMTEQERMSSTSGAMEGSDVGNVTDCYCHHLIFPGTVCPNCGGVAGNDTCGDKPDRVLEEERQAEYDEYMDHIREDNHSAYR